MESVMKTSTQKFAAIWRQWKYNERKRLAVHFSKNKVIKILLSMGTFDPPHLWHLQVAQCARVQRKLDFALFVPNNKPPHKGKAVGLPDITPSGRRYRWVVKSIRGNCRMRACPVELSRDGLSYTIDTMKQLVEMYGSWGYKVELYLLIGMDNVEKVEGWYQAPEMLKMCKLCIAPRNSRMMPPEKIAECLPGLKKDVDWFLIDCPDGDISSTKIREWYSDPELALCADYLVRNAVRIDIRRNNPWVQRSGKAALKSCRRVAAKPIKRVPKGGPPKKRAA
jgi:nicotinate-nucleotide adenylyltransferase